MIVIEEIEEEEYTIELELAVRDLTCLCPFNAETDTFSVQVRYQPMRGRVLELGAFHRLMKLYEGTKITHEALTMDVFATIIEQIQPASIEVVTVWAPVEGVECTIRMTT